MRPVLPEWNIDEAIRYYEKGIRPKSAGFGRMRVFQTLYQGSVGNKGQITSRNDLQGGLFRMKTEKAALNYYPVALCKMAAYTIVKDTNHDEKVEYGLYANELSGVLCMTQPYAFFR